MREVIRRLLLYGGPVALLLVLAGVVRAHGQMPFPDARLAYGDQYRYIAMAEHARSPLADQAPFAWRVVTPWLVSMLPAPTLLGFWWVTVAGLAATTLAVEWFLLGIGLRDTTTAAGATAFVMLGPATGYALWAYTYADAVPLFCLTLALGCAVRHHGAALFVVVLIGALAKESIVLAPLFAAALAWTTSDTRLLRWAGLSLLGAVLVLVGLRLLIPTLGVYSPLGKFVFVYVPPSLTAGSILYAIAITVGRVLAATIGTWTGLLPFALLWMRWPGSKAHLRVPLLVVIVCAAAQILVAEDVERLAAYAAPAVIAASALATESIAARWQRSPWALWAPIFVVLAYFWLPYAGWPQHANVYVSLGTLDEGHRLLAVLLFVVVILTLWPYRSHLLSTALRKAAPVTD
jgi:hypothetical protein